MSSDQLRDYVGARAGDETVATSWSTATELVREFLTDHGFDLGVDLGVDPPTIPAEVTTRAILEVGAELYHRKNTKNGFSQFATGETLSPLRIARDPLVAARPILAPYLTTGGFA